MLRAALILTVARAQTGDLDLAVLGQYGVLGVFAVVLLVYARTTSKREMDRGDRLEAEVLRLNGFIQEEVVPALVSATNALRESTGHMRDELAVRRRDRDRA